MAKTSRLWTVIPMVLTMLTQSGRGQVHWSMYKAADGLAEPAVNHVTLTSQGRLMATSRNGLMADELDGFSVTNFPAPTNYAGRIEESPGGQRWALVPDGLMEMKDGAWHLHRVAEIASVFRAGAIGTAAAEDGLPFYAARQGCVLFLLPGALMEFSSEDPDAPRTRILQAASELRIGTFRDMAVASDGSLWLTGDHGVARAAGPVRNLGTNVVWQEFIPPGSLGVERLSGPVLDDHGGVVMLAESPSDQGKSVVTFDGRNWAVLPAGPGKFLRAWRGPDENIRAATSEAVFRWEGTNWLENQEISAGRIFDVAVEPSGAFWLATSEGLFRGAQQLWTLPADAANPDLPVESLTADAEGGLIYVAGGKLHYLNNGAERDFMLPQTTNGLPAAPRSFALKSGALLLELCDQLYVCHVANGSFTKLDMEPGVVSEAVGLLPDGKLCLLVHSGTREESVLTAHWESFDGKAFQTLPGAPPVAANRFSGFYVDRSGDWWMSWGLQVVWSRHNNGGAQWFASNDHTTPEHVVGFVEGPSGKIWCATLTEIWEFDGKGWMRLPGEFNHVNAVVRSRDGTIWVASNSGLFRYGSGAWIANGAEDGVPGGPVRAMVEDERGQLWAGTDRGLRLFHPEADPDPPRTSVRRITGEDRGLAEGDTLEVLFDGVDKWKYSTRLLYSYQLDQQGWSPFREAATMSFPRLAAGRHYFQVRAMDGNANVETVAATLNFTVLVPWYRDARWWAIFLPGAAAAVFFAGVAWNRHRRLVRSHAAVELAVADRTRELELATRELLHSQKMNALGTLAAGIAHDFNNILSIVKGSAQIIEDNLDQPAKVRTRLERIKTVVQQGADIVDAMLGFSRGSDSTASRCDINQVVAETLKLLGDRFAREVEIKFERAGELPEIEVPKGFIQQMLLNIIFNAAEAMTGRKRILLATRVVEKLPPEMVLPPEGTVAYILVSVQDWGGGMTPEIKARIFEPFFTTKAMSSRRGTGLGLSMVYELAKKMGAGLAVQSVVNEGSLFTLVLPLRRAQAAEDQEKIQTEHTPK